MDFNDTQPKNGGVYPKFYMRAVQDGPATAREGRPIFKDVEWVDIYLAGDKTTVPSFKVTDEHRRRWPDHYKAFRDGQAAPIVGTPVDQWPALSVSQVEELKALRIYTVEQLAGLSDQGLQALGMGARALQAKAKAFLDAAKGNAATEKYAQENEQMKAEMVRLQALVGDLAAELKATREGTKKGRTKKTVEQVLNA